MEILLRVKPGLAAVFGNIVFERSALAPLMPSYA
jgi:hypothetical protein